MAETRNDIQNGEEKRRRRGLWGLLGFLLILLAVLAVVVLAAYRDGTGFDVLRRYLHYGGSESAGGEVVYRYDASGSNRFAVLGSRLVVLSDTALRVLDEHGGEVWSTPVRMTAPALTQCGGRAVAYDVGGTELYVVDETGLLAHMTAGENEPYLAATVNRNGYLAVIAKTQNHKGTVSVYDEKMKRVFDFHSSRRFVADAYVTDDNARLAAVTLGQENSVFVSNVVIYRLDSEEPESSYDVSGDLESAIGQQGSRLITVGDTCLACAAANGTVEGTYSYGGSYLRDYDLGGDGFSVLLLNRYQSGSVGRLVTVDASAAELGSLEVREEILSVSAAGRYIAVLYANRLVVYNQDLQVYASLTGTDSVREALMRSDGSVLLLSAESAGLFLP